MTGSYTLNRRALLLMSVAAALPAKSGSPRLETLTDWLRADLKTRDAVPAATGPAPRGIAYTGDARMNAPWTALGTPAISVPMPVGDALPLGLQLTAAPGEDARLLRAAIRVYKL